MDTVTLGVHGFQYEPQAPNKEDDPRHILYPRWSRELREVGDFEGYEWYSYPKTWDAWCKAAEEGYPIRYYAAWDKAETKAAWGVIGRVRGLSQTYGKVNLIGHSLGTRVILCAIEQCPDLPINKVVLLSGADTVKHAESVRVKCPVLNVIVEEDDVLGYLGRWFSPELGPEATIGRNEVKGFHNWRPEGADDHWDAWRTSSYWEKYREFLK
jgi:pimeloyl-ACP methyl ester carboxylesterase